MKKIIFNLLALFSLSFLGAQTVSLKWANRMGGIANDQGLSIVSDTWGNVYTTGYFAGIADFDPGTEISNLYAVGATDIFICKFNSSGNFVWAKQMGGSFNDHGNSITLDANGDVYTTGYFSGTADFDPGTQTYNLSSSSGGTDNIFVSKLDSAGNFVWARQLGEGGSGRGNSIKVDASGNVYTIGNFADTADFDPGIANYNLKTAGANDIFISKLNSSGNFVWAKSFGSFYFDNGYALALDTAANIFSTGNFTGIVDFDPGVVRDTLSSVGGTNDIFVLKLDSSGKFLWARQMGGNLTDAGKSIDVDVHGNVYTTGLFQGKGEFDPGTGSDTLTSKGAGSISNIFVSKLNSSGIFVWASLIGSSLSENSNSIAIDTSGNVYVTGDFQGTANAGIYSINSTGGIDVFVSRLNSSGNFDWIKQMGGSGTDNGFSINADRTGNLYTSGSFQTTVDFDPGAGIADLISAGASDIFLQKLGKDLTTRVGSTENTHGIRVFPNPGNSLINIEFDKPKPADHTAIRIINIAGQVVFEKLDLSVGKLNLDVSEQPEGFYLIELVESENISRVKFIKN